MFWPQDYPLASTARYTPLKSRDLTCDNCKEQYEFCVTQSSGWGGNKGIGACEKTCAKHVCLTSQSDFVSLFQVPSQLPEPLPYIHSFSSAAFRTSRPFQKHHVPLSRGRSACKHADRIGVQELRRRFRAQLLDFISTRPGLTLGRNLPCLLGFDHAVVLGGPTGGALTVWIQGVCSSVSETRRPVLDSFYRRSGIHGLASQFSLMTHV
jgi:hypothetical protein